METAVKLEFVVEMTCEGCASAVKKALQGRDGVQLVSIDIEKQQVVVSSLLPAGNVQGFIESTGKRAVLQGFGSGKGISLRGMGAAVAMMAGQAEDMQGVIRMVQLDEQECVLEGTMDGLTPGENYTLAVYELGDISQGCNSCGDLFQGPFGNVMGYGDIGKVSAADNGRAEFRLVSPTIKVWDIIGRSMLLTAQQDRLACGIIARSSGLFENTKRICACDGVSIWDERDVPIAGEARQKHKPQQRKL